MGALHIVSFIALAKTFDYRCNAGGMRLREVCGERGIEVSIAQQPQGVDSVQSFIRYYVQNCSVSVVYCTIVSILVLLDTLVFMRFHAIALVGVIFVL